MNQTASFSTRSESEWYMYTITSFAHQLKKSMKNYRITVRPANLGGFSCKRPHPLFDFPWLCISGWKWEEAHTHCIDSVDGHDGLLHLLVLLGLPLLTLGVLRIHHDVEFILLLHVLHVFFQFLSWGCHTAVQHKKKKRKKTEFVCLYRPQLEMSYAPTCEERKRVMASAEASSCCDIIADIL